jgi:predicted flavoprotein YhiN
MNKIALELTSCKFHVESRGQYRDEFVTAGGAHLQEVFF